MPHQLYCSDKHSPGRRRNKILRRHLGRLPAVATIYERDGGSCGLCTGRVDLALRYPDMGSASIDHILPVTRGGTNAADNIQLAHLGCNLEKKDRMPVEPGHGRAA